MVSLACHPQMKRGDENWTFTYDGGGMFRNLELHWSGSWGQVDCSVSAGLREARPRALAAWRVFTALGLPSILLSLQLPPDQPLTDQHPGPAAGQTGTSSEAAPTRTRPPSASTGTQGLWCSQGGQPWAGTPDLALSLRTVDSLTLQGLCGCDKRSPWPSSAEPWRVDWTSRCTGCLG